MTENQAATISRGLWAIVFIAAFGIATPVALFSNSPSWAMVSLGWAAIACWRDDRLSEDQRRIR